MRKFTEKDLRNEIKNALEKARKEMDTWKEPKWETVEFSNKDLGVFGGIIIDNGPATPAVLESLPKYIPQFIREHGATNSIFLLKAGPAAGDSDYFHYSGWIYWNSVRIPVENYDLHRANSYNAGLRQLFEVVDKARFELKLNQMSHKRIQKLSIEFKPK